MYLTEYEIDTSGFITLKINTRSSFPKEDVETFYLRPSPPEKPITKYKLTRMTTEQPRIFSYEIGKPTPMVYMPQVVEIVLQGIAVPLDRGDELVFTCQKI